MQRQRSLTNLHTQFTSIQVTGIRPMKSHSRHNSPAPGAAAAHTPVKLGDHFQLVLNWYKRSARGLVGEEIVQGLHISNLMKVLGNPIWNHVYHCWEIELKHMPELQPYIEHQFDPSKYVYFIEAYNTN